MKIFVVGLGGYMGREVASLCLSGYAGCSLAGGYDVSPTDAFGVPCFSNYEKVNTDFDCIVDFSHHAGTKALTDFAKKVKKPLVIATTAQTDEERQMIMETAKEIPVFFAANYSMGIAVLTELAKKTARLFPDAEIEIIEKHHDRKLDAPSGTALAIARELQTVRENAELHLGRQGQGKRTPTEIGIHAVRMGNIVGDHEILIGTQNQTLILKHEAHSRALFAEGALTAAGFLVNQSAGLYDMKSLLKEF